MGKTEESPERADDLYPQTKLLRFDAGDLLFKEGSESREMYIIRKGRVRVAISKEGATVPITELGKGCHVGEMSFIAGIPRTATVTALEPVIANRISEDILKDDALSISGWALSIARVLVERIKRTTELLGDYMASGPHPIAAEESSRDESSENSAPLEQQECNGELHLKGVFDQTQIDSVKVRVRKALLKCPEGIVIDFSGVIDADMESLGYLLQLAKSRPAQEGKIKLRNMQLIRNKVAGIKEIRSLIESSNLPLRRVEQGEILIRQGDYERSMFVIKSGEFEILEEVKGQNPVFLGKSRSGDVVGEMSLLREGKRSATVKAAKTSTVLEITPREFFANVYTVPDWFMNILEGLVKRLRNTNEMLSHVTSQSQKVEDKKALKNPLSIEIDGESPGVFILSGSLSLGNVEYLSPMIRQLLYSGQKEITIRMSKVESIDPESIRYLLNLYMVLKENGGQLHLVGTQKQILWLKQKNREESIAGLNTAADVGEATGDSSAEIVPPEV